MSKKAKKETGIELNVGVCQKALRKIVVTKEHIKRGIQGDANSCPIALAVRDSLGPLGKDARVSVSGSESSFTIEKDVNIPLIVCGEKVSEIAKTIRIEGQLNLGKKADRFVEKFDDERKSVKPTTFISKPEFDITADDAYCN